MISLRGGDGNDILLGGNDDDFLRRRRHGDDILDGGAGWDRATYAVGATAGVTVDLNIQGVAQNTGSKGFDTLIGIEHLSGTVFDDLLTGDGGDNWIWGGSDGSGVTGNDTYLGRRRQRPRPGRHRQLTSSTAAPAPTRSPCSATAPTSPPPASPCRCSSRARRRTPSRG